jgi:ribonuclease G
MSVEIQRKLVEILKKRPATNRTSSCASWCIPAMYERMRREDEKFIIELEKKFFGRISFRPDPGMHISSLNEHY